MTGFSVRQSFPAFRAADACAPARARGMRKTVQPGDLFGTDQPVALQLLDIPPAVCTENPIRVY